MGGGKRRSSAARCRRAPAGTVFLGGSHLAEWAGPGVSTPTPPPNGRRCGRRRGPAPPPPRSAAFSYCYKLDSPIDLGGATPIVAFEDRSPCADPSAEVPTYEYDPSAIGESTPFGLGFQGEKDEEEEEETEEDRKMNDGFVVIGGVRVYTEDVSSPGEESDDENDDEDDNDSSGEECSDEEDSSSSSSGCENDGSEIDEEVMQDYLEGIGGASQLFKGVRLGKNLDVLYGNVSDEGCGEGKKISGAALMRASKQYGMMVKCETTRGRWRGRSGDWPAEDPGMLASDDAVFDGDLRMLSRKKKGSSSQLSRSWPNGSHRSKKINSEKKKQRKAMIAAKRRERMFNRGVNLEQINMKLKQIVLDQIDMSSFERMHPHDCSQVQRLASIYRLRSDCQGSGKKRFVTVTRTAHTSLPSSSDNMRLEKLLGCNDDDDFIVTPKEFFSVNSKGKSKMWKAHLSAPGKLVDSVGRHGSRGSGKKKLVAREGRASYASRPVSFVLSGGGQDDQVREMEVDVHGCVSSGHNTVVDNSPISLATGVQKVGSFEMHTKGFGSRMMAKMGFVEGGGLGKDGQGIAQPIAAIKRPKSLGLGIDFSDTTESDNKNSEPGKNVKQNLHRANSKVNNSQVGAFERHTKGFGSKMMARMGFTPGTGLGKDGQGIVNPLTAVKLPKSRGLGA